MRPLGHRIIVQPDKAPTVTESGFIIPSNVDIPAMSGIVTAVGDGPLKATRLRQAVIRQCLRMVDTYAGIVGRTCAPGATLAESTMVALRDDIVEYAAERADLDRHVQVGDRVLFAVESGHEIVLNERTDDVVIVLSEDDVLATLEG